MTYAEKLKDPRWRQRRLTIIERDKHRCQLCFSNKEPFHVHHKYYIPGLEPWEYKNEVLVTLCADCHEIETLLYKRQVRFSENMKSFGLQDGWMCLACGEKEYKIKGTNIICKICGWDVDIEYLMQWALDRMQKAKAP